MVTNLNSDHGRRQLILPYSPVNIKHWSVIHLDFATHTIQHICSYHWQCEVAPEMMWLASMLDDGVWTFQDDQEALGLERQHPKNYDCGPIALRVMEGLCKYQPITMIINKLEYWPHGDRLRREIMGTIMDEIRDVQDPNRTES